MTLPIGVIVPFKFFFTKNGALSDPSIAPTATLGYSDGSFLSPAPSLIHDGVGRYSYNLPALDNNQAGALTMLATTTDLTMDNTISQAVYEVGTNDVVSIWTYATRTLTSFGTLVSDIWSYVTRTLTSGSATAQQVWEYATRTLTAYGIVSTTRDVGGTIYVTQGYVRSVATGNAITFTLSAAPSVTPVSTKLVVAGVTLTGTLSGVTWTGDALTAAVSNTMQLSTSGQGIQGGLIGVYAGGAEVVLFPVTAYVSTLTGIAPTP